MSPSDGAALFGSVADEYERYRMGYPEELVDAVLAYAAQPIGSALEVGAGTGKATRCFATRGVHVTALEPDVDMAALLDRSTRGLPVTTVVSSFERFIADQRFDLLYAAAAWHWTEPRTRWFRARDSLAPGGVIALFGRPCEPSDVPLVEAIEVIERDVIRDGHHAGHPWTAKDLADAGGFADVVEQSLPGTAVITANAFVGRLRTTSAYLRLEPMKRQALINEVRRVVPEYVAIDATTQLVMARRGPSQMNSRHRGPRGLGLRRDQ